VTLLARDGTDGWVAARIPGPPMVAPEQSPGRCGALRRRWRAVVRRGPVHADRGGVPSPARASVVPHL